MSLLPLALLAVGAFAFLKKSGSGDDSGITDLTAMTSADTLRSRLPPYGQFLADVIARVASEQGISPFLIAGIISRESRFGDALTPAGPGGTGDGGHGRGLMQIDDRWHAAYLAQGTWQDPYSNITYGVGVLKAALAAFAAKGLTGDTLLAAGVAAYNAGVTGVWNALQANQMPDSVTTGHNYSDDVLSRTAIFAQSSTT